MNQTLASALRFGLLAVAAVAVTAFVLFTRGGDTAPAVALDTVTDDAPAAAAPQSGPAGFPDGGAAGEFIPSDFPDFTISSDEDCLTGFFLAGGAPDKKCLVPPGDSFEVDVTLKDLGSFGEFGYFDIAIRLDYSWNLTVKKPPVAAPGSPCDDGDLVWDDSPQYAGSFWIRCEVFGETDYVGPLVTVTFNCPPFKSKETITLANNVPDNFELNWGTALQSKGWLAEVGRHESLIINCDNYYPWDVHGSNQSAELDGIVDLPNDILGVILHFCPQPTLPCSKDNLP